MDRLTSMAVFARVVEANSFSAAARTLGISQATASKHVQMLEGWLGSRLLNRTTRRISLTEIGESFYGQCNRILEDIDDARNAGKESKTLQGALRLSAPVCFGSTRLGPILRGFAALHPAITLDVFLTDRTIDPLEDGFDMALCLGTGDGLGLVVRRVAAFPNLVCAAPAYLEARREAPGSPDALAGHLCLLDRQLFPRGWQFVGDGSARLPLAYSLIANNALILRDVALVGGGVLIAPEFVVDTDLAAGRLVRLMPDWPVQPVELSLAFQASRQLSGKIRALTAYLAERVVSA